MPIDARPPERLQPEPKGAVSSAGRSRRLVGVWSLRGWGVGVFALPIHACYFTMAYLLLRGARSPGLVDLLLLVLAFELYFAYGVLVNDYFDREVDVAAGKSSTKRGHSLTRRELASVIFVQLAGSAIVIALIGGGLAFDLLWGLSFALATLYSAPPARLRAKGIWGFVADSLIEKPLPILIVFSLFGYYGYEAVLFPVCGELLDSIFKHQVEDFEADSKLGVRTFAVCLGKGRSLLAERAIFDPGDALAVLSLFSVTYVVLVSSRAITAMLWVVMLLGLAAFALMQRSGRVRRGFPFPEPPLVGYLNFAFRTVLLGGLALSVLIELPGYYLLSILVLLSIAVYLKGYAHLVPDFLRYAFS